MFGQMLFADMPFSSFGDPPRLDTGWRPIDGDDCSNSCWKKIETRCAEIEASDKPESNTEFLR